MQSKKMSRIILLISFVCLAVNGFSQKDSATKNQPDTIVVGKFIIIKKNKPGSISFSDTGNRHSFVINTGNNNYRHKKPSNITTNWFIFDLGFANYNDQTNYTTANQSTYLNAAGNGGTPFTKEDFRLKTFNSSNVNIWFFMQKLNITKHVLNLKYGFGLEMYNFRYENNISYNNNPAYIYTDSVNFSKDKLFASYLTVPFMLNINTSPHSHHGFSFSTGVSAGYLVGSHTKQISEARGKQKVHGDFDLNPWRLAYVAELGIGFVHLYGSYSIDALHSEALTQYPYAVGIRFSNW
jgi:hypothetical protein